VAIGWWLAVSAAPRAMRLTVNTRRYAASRGVQLAADLPEYEQLALTRTPVLGDRRGWRHRFRCQATNGLPLEQCEDYLVRGTTTITITQMVAQAVAEERAEHLERVVSGIEVDRPAAVRRLWDRMRRYVESGRARGTLRARLPAGWLRAEQITVLAADGSANVVTSINAVDPGIGSEEYAQNQGQMMAAEFPAYEEIDLTPEEMFGGLEGYVRAYSWRPDGGEPVTQWQAYSADAGRGYIATATCRAALVSQYGNRLRAMLLRITAESR
jgi:hypothetical protein